MVNIIYIQKRGDKMSYKQDYYGTGSYKTDHWRVKKLWDNDYYNLIWR